MLLTDRYLADGFCSNSEPLLVVQSVQVSNPSWKVFWNDPDPMPSFSLGYVKGMARMSSLFALLHFCWVEGLKVKECHPVLHESVLRIWAHHVEHVNKVDEAQTHRIAFHTQVKEEGSQPAELTQSNFAAKEPVKIWQASPSLNLVWTVRWAAKGLMPVKPCIYLKACANLPTGRSLCLTAGAD
jgi:hypothetical protein